MKTEFSVQSRQTVSAGGWGLGTRLSFVGKGVAHKAILLASWELKLMN